MTHYRLQILIVFLIAQTINAETLIVSNNNDAGAGSLRQAVLDASAGDEIVFNNSLAGQTIQLGSSINIGFDLNIQGLGADQLTLSGGNSTRMFTIQAAAEVSISGLEFVDGNAAAGGAISNSGAGTVLTITDSQFLNNFAGSSGGAIDNNGATLNIFNSTLSGNTTPSLGGAINNAGSGFLMIRNSTLSGNQSTGFDGGAITNLGGTLDIANSTVVNNFAFNFAGGIGNNSPSNISNIRNTIVAGNTTGTGNGLEFGNLAGTGAIVSGGGNLIGVAQGAGQGNTLGVFNQAGDQFGTVANPLDPMLGGSDMNGGTTLTHLPQIGSPAIDQGVNLDLPANDQRGLARVSNAVVDAGSVEIQAGLAEEFFINGFEG